jgi:ubiquinone/menaquinone biosynthesis C-methylase UbiE
MNSTKVKGGRHDYNEEYRRGAHWDTGEPSSNIPEFLEYLDGNEKIIDVGCGTGTDALYLAQQGYDVVGVDQSKVGIEMARESAEVTQGKKPDFVLGTIEALPFDKESFDVAYSGYVLGGETLPKQFEEIARVLKPGSIVYIVMFIKTEYENPSERNESNPKPFIFDSLSPYFEVLSEEEDTYSEEDDEGMHTHNRIKLILKSKS